MVGSLPSALEGRLVSAHRLMAAVLMAYLQVC